MLNNIKIASKDTFIYSLGNISTKIIGLVLLPLYTDELSVAEYGVLGTVEITIQVLIAAFSLSLRQALSRWYWDKKYRHKQKSIFYTTLTATGIGLIIMFFIIFPFSNRLSISLLDSNEYAYLFKLLIINAAVQTLSRIVLITIRLQRKAVRFTISNILKLIITLGLTIFFIVKLERGVEGIIEAQIIGFIFLLIFNSKFVLRNINPVFEFSIFKEMLRFSYPLAISSIGGILLTVTDKYAVSYILGMDDMGLYNLGFKIANVLKVFLINSIVSALGPLRFKMLDKPDNKRFYSKMMTYTSFGFILFLLGLTLFSEEAIKLLTSNPDYWSAYKIVPILCFAQLFELLRRNANFGLIAVKKTKIISSIMISISLLNIGLNILLILLWSNIGAAIAILLAQITYFQLIYHYSQKYYFIPYEIKKVLMMVLLGGIIVTISFLFVNHIPLIPRIAIKLMLIISFPIILYFFNFYDQVELKRLKGAWHKWKNPAKWKDNIKDIKIN